MWTKRRTRPAWIDCRPPYSFTFDLIAKLWRQPRVGHNAAPIHRVCTLMRKMGARTVFVECGLGRADVCSELDDLNAVIKGDAQAQALVLTFFGTAIGIDPASRPVGEAVLGQTIIINYKRDHTTHWLSYIYEAVIRVPDYLLSPRRNRRVRVLNMHLPVVANFTISVGDQHYQIQGIYYCQQNGYTSSCAHACLRMLINTYFGTINHISTRAIIMSCKSIGA